MGKDHAHASPDGSNEKLLWIAMILTTVFLIAEVIGGIVANSPALISDAVHMFTDTAALAISLAAIALASARLIACERTATIASKYWPRHSMRSC